MGEPSWDRTHPACVGFRPGVSNLHRASLFDDSSLDISCGSAAGSAVSLRLTDAAQPHNSRAAVPPWLRTRL